LPYGRGMWLPPAAASDLSVFALTLLAAVIDLRCRRIPNALTFTGALAGCAYAVATAGAAGAASSAAGWALGLLLFLPFYALGGMGAGDVKLLACIGAWLGPAGVVRVAIYASIVGGALALLVALRHGYLRRAVENIRVLITSWSVMGLQPIDTVTLESSKGPRLAYAIPILAGTCLAVYLR
jgi:prepilin peptidase CpaA